MAAYVIEIALFDGDMFLVRPEASDNDEAIAEHAMIGSADSIILTPRGRLPTGESRLVHRSEVEAIHPPRVWRGEVGWAWEIGPADPDSLAVGSYAACGEHHRPVVEVCAARPPDRLTVTIATVSIRLDLTMACELQSGHRGWHQAGAPEHRLHWTADGKWRVGE